MTILDSPRKWTCVLTAVLMVFTLAGCGGSDGDASTDEGDTGTEVAAQGVGAPPGDNTGAEVRKDASGRKWFDDIPYDVWYADPLAVAGNSTPVGATPGDPGDPMGGDPEPVTPDPMPAAGGASSWDKIIPADVVAAEMKDAQNKLNTALTSVASYNQAYLSLPPYIHTMAVMGAIGAEHPGEIRWKKNGLVLRDLAGEIAMAGTPMGGPRGKKAMEEPFFKIQDTFSGSPPSDLDPDPEVSYADIAEMGALMKRIDIGFNKRLVIEVGSEEALADKKELVRREAAVVAALGKVITLEGYGYFDDEEFTGHAQGMVDAGVQMVEAADDGDFEKYDAAKTAIIKACADCHRTYR